jgi:SOS-response transcriptional repressor LexA
MENIRGDCMRNTKLEMKMLDMIKSYVKDHGYSPTVREIAEILDIKSTSTAQRHLNILEKEGYITKTDGMSRTIRINNR